MARGHAADRAERCDCGHPETRRYRRSRTSSSCDGTPSPQRIRGTFQRRAPTRRTCFYAAIRLDVDVRVELETCHLRTSRDELGHDWASDGRGSSSATQAVNGRSVMEVINLGAAEGLPPVNWDAVVEGLEAGAA